MATAADLLRCSLCLSGFEDPRALPCLHTFCMGCLIDLSGANQQVDTLKCPVCQEHHKMPLNGVIGFRKDFRINSFMEFNRNKERSVRTTRCKRHPKMEVTHFCRETDCNRAVLCTRCAAQSHRNHLVHPIKSICKEKLGQLRKLKLSAQENRNLIGLALGKLDENHSENFDKVKTQIKEFHAKLDQLEKKITADLLDKNYVEFNRLMQHDGEMKVIQSQLEILETELSDTVPNIVQANADKHLDRDFERLQETLNNWNLSYSLFQVDNILQTAFSFILPENNSFVKTISRQGVKGVSVGLLGRTASPVKAEEIVTWQQKDDDVKGIACHSYGGGGVTILSSSHLRVYKQNHGEMFHSTEHEEGNRVATIQQRCHAILDRTHDQVQLFYSWPIFLDEDDYTIHVRGNAGSGISGTENYLVYSAWHEPRKSQIICFSVAKNPPKFLWQRKFGSFMTRSFNALESSKELLVVVAAESCPDRKKATALTAVNGPSKPLWKITFEALDREAAGFDLRDMCNDGHYFYVLNTEEGCVHVISTDGVVLSKILHNLDRPRSLACSSERKELVVACSGGAVKVYKLVYND